MPHNGTFPGGGEREEDCNIDGYGSNPLPPVLQLAAFVVVAAVGFVLTLVGDCRVPAAGGQGPPCNRLPA